MYKIETAGLQPGEHLLEISLGYNSGEYTGWYDFPVTITELKRGEMMKKRYETSLCQYGCCTTSLAEFRDNSAVTSGSEGGRNERKRSEKKKRIQEPRSNLAKKNMRN